MLVRSAGDSTFIRCDRSFGFAIQKLYVLLQAPRFLAQHRAIEKPVHSPCATAVGCCLRHHLYNCESTFLTCPAPYGHNLVKFVHLLPPGLPRPRTRAEIRARGCPAIVHQPAAPGPSAFAIICRMYSTSSKIRAYANLATLQVFTLSENGVGSPPGPIPMAFESPRRIYIANHRYGYIYSHKSETALP